MAALPRPDRANVVEINRTSLRVYEWGDPSAPTVIAAHGAYDHARMFDELAPRVAALGYHVRCVDLRSHGDSGATHTGHTFDACVLDLAALAGADGGPVGLLGHSMGAGMLSNVASTWPERVRWLVSLDSLGPPDAQFADFDLGESATAGWTGLVKTLGRGRRVFPDQAAMRAQRAAVNVRMPDRWVHHLVAHGSIETDGGYSWKWAPIFNTFLPNGFTTDWVRSDYAQIRCPVLALMGAAPDTWSFPADEIADRAACFADIRVEMIPDAGHYVHLEQPDAVMGHLEAFLGEVDR